MKNIKLVENETKAQIILSKHPLNILDIQDLQELHSAFKKLKEQKHLKLVTIESDQKIFSAGVDISDHSGEKINELLENFHKIFYEMLELEIPTISLVKAGCIGGGCELALFSDFVLATEKAYFSQPEIKLGCYPPVSMAYFPYITSNKKALEIILTGNKLFAEDALKFGLINHVFPEDKFDEEAQNFIDSILSKDLNIIRTTTKAYKQLNYAQLKEKLKSSEKIYLEEIDHDKIMLEK